MELQDIYNWQLGQYIEIAYTETLAKSFGKSINIYPREPMFRKKILESTSDSNGMTKAQEELETMKFKNFFDNLGNYVAIKKKGGK